MLGSAAVRVGLAPGGVLAAPWVRNELWRRARAVPTLDLQFAANKSLVDATTGQNLITFTRASSGTYLASDGLIKTAAINEARFDHDPDARESLGLLVEEQRTNLLLRSEEFNVSPTWSLSGATLPTITANAGVAPDGTASADLFTRSVVSSSYISQNIVKAASSIQYTFSVFVKQSVGNFCALRTQGTYPARAEVVFNVANGTISSPAVAIGAFSGASASITRYSDGWYRLRLTATSDAVAGIQSIVSFNSNGVAVDGTDSAANSAGLLWGAQLEAGAFPTSYIPTTAAAVTRSADVVTDFSRGASIRTLFGKFRSPASGTRPIVSLDDNSINNRIELFTSGTDPKLLITSGGTAQADLDAGSFTANTTAQLAGRFATNDFAASVSGGNEVLDSSGSLPAVDRMRIGSDQAGNYLNGTVARITGWDVALTTLQAITR